MRILPKITNITSLFLFPILVWGQDAVHNFGNIQIHDTGLVGFHMDIINNGAFDQNKGLVGFYSEDKALTVSGSSNPVFYDTEIAVDHNLYVDNTIGVLNNTSFISGNIITARVASQININFLNESFYIGEGNETLVDGYASVSNKGEFTFPIGQENRWRPLKINSNENNDYAKCAYFYEDPNTPSIFGISFNTDKTATDLLSVSNYEFWHLESEKPSTVTLSWDELSYASLLAEFVTDLKVVGWSVSERKWVSLGNTNVEGNLDKGTVTSEEFIPSDYAILTLGGNSDILETLDNIELGNYYMTPNGDGINDVLVIKGLENSPNNSLQIFNRYGVMVYSKQNYDNNFNGISNVTGAVSRNTGLASGVYFYIITLNDLKQKHQGYLYLTTYQEN
ncbi:gliding motility-associated C-terminal domain-containing protein [Maribacter sp. 2304DJ31-5]|uniref:gliding motility-associated C-terminal domain-containing protein n=1 Tax=Maribacter sp. 2304DJ31-5 TaxID=3386273 RepID=UPI0039BC9E2E